jgi:hypothetical protein
VEKPLQRFAALAALLVLFLPATAKAQLRAATAELAGRVVDQTQGVLPGALIAIVNSETGERQAQTTGPEGSFAFPPLPVGTYRIEASLSGFTTQVLEAVVLQVGNTTTLTLTLTISPTTERVTVPGGTPLVDVRRKDVNTSISAQQIASLPINGRTFISFSTLAPGVTTDVTPDQGSNASSGLTFAGQRARSNNITLDGLDNNEVAVGSVRATISQDAVREFQVLTNSYAAEFGKASGGVVNIVTKSGANDVTGGAFLFVRHRALNSRGYFEKFDAAGNSVDLPKAPFDQQQFGGTLGGPLVKNRAFYFVSVERLSADDSRAVTIDDTTLVANPIGPGVLGTPASILRNAGFIFDTGTVPFRVATTQVFGRADFNISSGQRLTMRANTGDELNENTEPFGGITARSRAGALDSRDWMVAAMHGYTLTSRLYNDLRVQVASRNQVVRSLDSACGGPCIDETMGGPQVNVAGVANLGRQEYTPQTRRSLRFQVLDTLSWQHGAHHIKAGFDFSTVDFSKTAFPYYFGGQYLFVDFPEEIAALFGLPAAISGIQAFALGLPGAYIQGYGNSAALGSVKDLSLFAQDEWSITNNLSINAGLRYQVQAPPGYTYRIAGYPGPYEYPPDHNNFAPRTSVAWNPGGGGRTGIHAAYGLFYDNTFSAIPGVPKMIDGIDGVRVYVMQGVPALLGWQTPGRQLPDVQLTGQPPLVLAVDPGVITPYAHHVSSGIVHELLPGISASADFVYVNGYGQIGLVDYNPLVPALGAGRRPADVDGIAGTSASVLQYTSFAKTRYRGLLASIEKRFDGRWQLLASYTLGKTNDSSSDYVERPSENGLGRDPNDLQGLPLGFDPAVDYGASVQDQRHRLVISGLVRLPARIDLSAIVAAGSGRTYNILAGLDFNGDGDAGAADRARRNPADASSAVPRNSGRLPASSAVDVRVSRSFALGNGVRTEAIFEVFNLFNRTNFTDVNNVFGAGAYPDQPLRTFGQFTQTGPPRQAQVAVRVSF